MRDRPQLILLSDDKRNRELATTDGFLASSTRDYVDGLQGEVRDRLVDLVAGGVDDTGAVEQRGRRIYDDVSQKEEKASNSQYLPQETLTAGVKNGRYLQGHFNANQYNYLEGTVRVPGMNKNVLLVGRKAMNRAVDGDLVVVELLPKEEWKAPGDEVLDQDSELAQTSLL